MNNKLILPIALLIAGLGAGFFGGMQYRNYQLQKARGSFGENGTFQRFMGNRTGTNGGGMMGRGGVFGSIISIDASGITVKLKLTNIS